MAFISNDIQSDVAVIFLSYFQRAPEFEAMQHYVGVYESLLANPETADSAFAALSAQIYADGTANNEVPSGPTITNAWYVNYLYTNILGRAPDEEGLEYWIAELDSGVIARPDLVGIFVAAALGSEGRDAQYLSNRTEVAVAFSQWENSNPVLLPELQYNSAQILAGVNEGEASVEHAFAHLASALAPVGNTFTLTTAIDNIVGTSGDDTIVGVIGTATAGTFNTGDSINGGAGNDTLKIITTSGPQTIVPASLTNVETIQVQALANSTIDLANATGVETLAAVNSTNTTTFTNVGALANISVSNSTSGGMRVDYTPALVAGLADAQNVSVNNANSTVNVAGIETFNIEATGANTLALTNDGNTVNVSGAGSLILSGSGTGADAGALVVTTLDASANTGGVTAALAGGNVTVTGGAGDDVFSFGAGLTATAGAVAGDVVDGGEGFDTVRVSNAAAANISPATDAAAFNALTSIERVAFDGAGGVTLNGATFTNAGITNIQFNTSGAAGVGDDVINNAGSARTYEFGTANAGAATFAMSAGATVLNLAMLGTQGGVAANDGTDANVGNVSITQAGGASAALTINIDSQGDLADAVNGVGGVFNDVGTITVAAGSTINISGEGNLDLAGLTNRGVIDASTATGNLVIEGSNITNVATAGADVITLGAGQDTVQFTTAAASGVINTFDTATSALGLQVDVINNFTAGANGDVLDSLLVGGDADYTALRATAQDAINLLSGGGATLQAAADLAAADVSTADEWTAFTFQGQTYAMYNAAADATYDAAADLLVQITGVAVADLTDANFA